ncbi:hypothetical protein ACSSS7_002384 [Eimeria intestinalis]
MLACGLSARGAVYLRYARYEKSVPCDLSMAAVLLEIRVLVCSEESLRLALQGTGTGPQARFTTHELDFGEVIVHTNKLIDVDLVNLGDIAATFSMKSLSGQLVSAKELSFSPSKGCINVNKSERLQALLCPSFLGPFEVQVAWAIEASPEDILLTVKIIPNVDSLEFGVIPFGFEEVRNLTLSNTSEAEQTISVGVVRRDEDTYADITVKPTRLIIPPRESRQVEIILRPSKAQAYFEEIVLDLPGLTQNYLLLPLRGSSKTPQVVLEPESRLIFDDVFVNTPSKRTFLIKNTSRLSAQFCVIIQPGSKNGVIVASPSDGLVPASATTEITLRLYASAPGEIRSTCRVMIAGLKTSFDLQLHACASGPKLKVDPKELQWGTAVGSPVIMTAFDASIDFQQVCTSVPRCKSFSLTNLGSRARQIAFLDGTRNPAGKQANSIQPKFVVKPSEFKLGPNVTKTVEIEAFSLLPGRASQVIICQESLGASTTPLRIARTVATADFFTPALVAKPSRLVFQHVWKSGVDIQVLRESLVLTNVSPIDLKCKAKTTSPFVVQPQYFSVEAQSTAVLAISFDAGFNGKHSAQVSKPLEISFQEHPKTEVIPLEATAEFPNIELEATFVDFGFVVNETTKRIPIRVKNKSSVPVSYGWYLSDHCLYKAVGGHTNTAVEGLAMPVHDIFDFTPFSGTLEPGAHETVYIRYWGLPNYEVSAVAVCSVEHGPDYSVRLVAELGTSAEAEPPTAAWRNQAEVDRQNLCKQMLEFYTAPNEQFALALTAKHETEGETCFPLTLVVSGGIAYQILLRATFVIPDLQISTDKLEFGGVRRGLRKTLTLRLRNEKSVPTHWRHRAVVDKSDRAQYDAIKCFAIEPKQAQVLPGEGVVAEKLASSLRAQLLARDAREWIDVKIHFYPARADKEVCARIVLCLDDNPKWKCILATGAPAAPSLEFIPPVVDFGHCLPSHTLRQEILIRNHSEDRCELYSLEFDEQYKETIALLRNYDGFDEAGIALLPVRQSAIIMGPSFCDKCRVADHLASGVRRVLTLEDCVEWALAAAGKKKKLSAAGTDVARDVEELIRLFETTEGDGEYLWGKRSPLKTKAAKGDRQGIGSGLPLHLLSAAVRLRVAQADCYAGTVFWVEPSLYCPSASDAGLAIARALPEEDIMVVTIKFGQLESALHEGELSSNPSADGVAYYRTLLAKTLQRERELVEFLDGKGQEPTFTTKTGGSPSGSDSKKKRVLGGMEAEARLATANWPDGDAERLKEELLSLQHTRQQIEANLYSSKAAQAFVQEQIATYSAAESELLKETSDETSRLAAVANAPGGSRRASHRQSFRGTQRIIAFSTAYLKPAISTEALLAQIQPLREPVIPAEPPLPESELVEVVYYPSTLPKATQPTNLVLLSPSGSASDKVEDEDAKNKLKKTRDVASPGSVKCKLRQDKCGEEEGLAVRLAVEPGYIRSTRWILEPHGEQRILLKFSADEERDFSYDLQFCLVGDSEIFRLEAKAKCCLPKLADFPQGCFENSKQERPDKQMLKKTYVVKEGVYEWGPLLAGRSAGFVKSLYSKGGTPDDLESVSIPPELVDFMTPLLLRNASPFDTLVKGSFAGVLGAEGADATRGRKAQKNQTADPTFLLFPPEVMLAKDMTACMHLWCLPKSEGEILDKLILTLGDNPRQFEIKLSSRCITPKIHIQADSILFGRVLTGSHTSRSIRIENPTPFPVRWSFTTQESPHKCFAFTPERGGILEPFSDESLRVEFEAPAKPTAVQCRLLFKCVDAEGISVGPEIRTVSLSAEAFSMESGVELPSKTHILDFGKVQAYQEAEIPFSVYNKGKYSVHFDIDMSNPKLENVLSVEPRSGELKPGEVRKGVARLRAKREVELVGDVELPIFIKDSENGIPMDPPPQPMQVVAIVAFNEISLSPPRGLNFGPVESGKTSQL